MSRFAHGQFEGYRRWTLPRPARCCSMTERWAPLPRAPDHTREHVEIRGSANGPVGCASCWVLQAKIFFDRANQKGGAYCPITSPKQHPKRKDGGQCDGLA